MISIPADRLELNKKKTFFSCSKQGNYSAASMLVVMLSMTVNLLLYTASTISLFLQRYLY